MATHAATENTPNNCTPKRVKSPLYNTPPFTEKTPTKIVPVAPHNA